MARILIVGDIHLGKSPSLGRPGIGNTLNSRLVDQITLLNWIIQTAIDNHVDTIVLTGDICEEVKPDYVLIELFVEFLQKCSSLNIEVDIIYGNHDLKRTGVRYASYLELIDAMNIDGVYVHKNIYTILNDDVGITLVPFRDRRSLECETTDEAVQKIASRLPYELNEIPALHSKILIGHLAIAGSLFVGDEIDNFANELMCPLSMFNGYDFVWMGHVHKPQVRQKAPCRIAHIGSLDLSDFGEMDHQKILILFDSSLPDKFKEIPVPSRPLRHMSIDVPSGSNATDYVLTTIRAIAKSTPLADAIVRLEVKIVDDIESIDRSVIENELYTLGAFYITNISESKNISIVPINIQQDIDNTIEPKEALNIWIETQEIFDNDKELEDFKTMALEIINEARS